jgi:hypothetical protein
VTRIMYRTRCELVEELCHKVTLVWNAEAYIWCKHNLADEDWCSYRLGETGWQSESEVFHFRHQSDAVTFSMMWS